MICRACGLEHDPLVRCGVAFRLATNKERLTDATNKSGEAGGVEASLLDGSGEVHGGQADRNVSLAGKTRNRRSREAYNSYQREYMRKKRSKAHLVSQ